MDIDGERCKSKDVPIARFDVAHLRLRSLQVRYVRPYIDDATVLKNFAIDQDPSIIKDMLLLQRAGIGKVVNAAGQPFFALVLGRRLQAAIYRGADNVFEPGTGLVQVRNFRVEIFQRLIMQDQSAVSIV